MKRIIAREEVCIGCRLCEIHCLVEHSPSKDVVKAYKRERWQSQSRVRVQEVGATSFALQCRHCEDPLCAYACLSGALERDDETGLVRFDAERCVGCWTCILACPYGVPERDPGRGRMAPRCDLCPAREVPACVANCPNEALVVLEDAGL